MHVVIIVSFGWNDSINWCYPIYTVCSFCGVVPAVLTTNKQRQLSYIAAGYARRFMISSLDEECGINLVCARSFTVGSQ